MAKYEDVVDDAQASIFMNAKLKTVILAYLTNTPVKFDVAKLQAPSTDTRVGKHTREVLLELGYSEEEIAQLVEKNIVKCIL